LFHQLRDDDAAHGNRSENAGAQNGEESEVHLLERIDEGSPVLLLAAISDPSPQRREPPKVQSLDALYQFAVDAQYQGHRPAAYAGNDIGGPHAGPLQE